MRTLFCTILSMVILVSMVGCGNIVNDCDNKNQTDKITGEAKSDSQSVNSKESQKYDMKLYINDTLVPVIWEDNASTRSLMEDVSEGDMVISMSRYGGNEQVGSLRKQYRSNDKQMTTHNGDIVLYNSNNLVVFYGSNSWAYTKLGKIDLPEQEVTDLLSNEDVIITIKK
ncbi:cyclophilin-like fold protein [Granulicatella sp. zg-84]|uniref:cyclophilin-like fold protein n=1 Tax=Granulicatella sp. zg-84 TaxID=2678503 RepID=UPI001F0818FE|nr:cyclophilin-like fold protein [Granulicatella sp. zg-84]